MNYLIYYKFCKETVRLLLLTGSLFVHSVFANNKSNTETLQKITIKKMKSSISSPSLNVLSQTSNFTNRMGFIDSVAKFKVVLNNTNASSSIKAPEPILQNKKAFKHLQFILRKYRNQNVYIKITKKTHIAVLQKQTSENGDLYLEKNGKFRISINSQPAPLLVFDGSYLWYQPDREEKLVLKFDSHPQISLFSSLFNYEKFFDSFSAIPVHQKKINYHAYILEPKKNMKPISKMILSCGKYINGVKILWEGSGDWQYYIFSKTWFRKHFPENLFIFNTQGFEIMEGSGGKPKSKPISN